jgi:hypothetical protein
MRSCCQPVSVDSETIQQRRLVTVNPINGRWIQACEGYIQSMLEAGGDEPLTTVSS